jgi:hypothetical protein
LEKPIDRHVQDFCYGGQASGADAIGSVFIFLDLLEGNAQRRSKFGLRQSLPSEKFDVLADKPINRIGFFFI